MGCRGMEKMQCAWLDGRLVDGVGECGGVGVWRVAAECYTK
jgi:hypothetical protein